MTYLITSAFVGPIQQMRMFRCLYAYSRLGFSHDYSCHRYTAASSLSQSFHPYHKARALNQSISVLFYVCSHQGDIRSIRDVSLSEDIPEKDSQFKALVTSDVFVIPVSLSSLSLRLYFSFDVGLV